MSNPSGVSVAAVFVVFGQEAGLINEIIDQIEHLDWVPLPIYIVNNQVGRALGNIRDSVLLEPLSNLGFCGGVNLAARKAAQDGHTHLLILNLDITILDGSLISQLLEVFQVHKDCAFASPGISFWPDVEHIWYRGGRIVRPFWLTRHPDIGKNWPVEPHGAMKTDYFSGCCVLADLNLMLSAGGFDEDLFMYYDEADLATRVAGLMGKYSYFLDAPLVAHAKNGRRFNENEAYFHARNSRKLLDRYETGLNHAVGVLMQLIIIPLQLSRCDSSKVRRAYLRGYFRGRSRSHPHQPNRALE